MKIPTIIPAKTRRHPARKQTSTPPPPPTGPLEVLSATVTGFQDEAAIVSLVFNTSPAYPLIPPSSANPEQWSAIYDGFLYVASSIESGAYNELQLIMPRQNDAFDANSISYAADPSDIEDAAGRTLAAIVDMPLD